MTPKIISELGINHCGQIDMALEMIDKSYQAGATAIKLQKRDVKLVYKDIWDQPRDDGNPYGWTTQGEQKTGLEFSKADYCKIDDKCSELGIEWFASAWDFESLKFLLAFQPMYMKIASAMTSNVEFVNAVADQGIYTFISTGGMRWAEMDWIYHLFVEKRTPFCMMHCTALYPCPPEKLNLNCIAAMKARYDKCDIGYSGHEVGIYPSVWAMDKGAAWIERHVTLDRSMYGSDQSASLEFQGLKRLCDAADMYDKSMGDCIRKDDQAEQKVLNKLRYWE